MMNLLIFSTIFLLGSVSGQINDCKIASSLHTSLHVLNILQPDIFSTDKDELKTLLTNRLVQIYTALDNATILALPDDQLYDLASMIAMVQDGALDSIDSDQNFWLTKTDLNVLRIGFERVALENIDSSEEQNYLAAFMANLDTREVLSVACDTEYTWTKDARKVNGFEDGCYTSSPISTIGNVEESEFHCIQACREEGSKFSSFSGETCLCTSSASDLGTYADAPDCAGIVDGRKFIKTGLGVPIKTMIDPESANNSITFTFEENIIGFEQVRSQEESSSSFIAVYPHAIVLHKVVSTSDGGQAYQYMDHKRWDCTTATDESCIRQLQTAGGFLVPDTSVLTLEAVISYTVFPMFVTYNHTMDLDSDEPFSTELFNDPAVKAGDPMAIPGGEIVDHILILHGDTFPEITIGPPVKATLLRVQNGNLIQLYNAINAEAFGQFLHDPFVKYPVAIASRNIGRKSYLFVGSHIDSLASQGNIKLYEVTEELRMITQFTGYGRMRLDNVVSGTFEGTNDLRDLLYAQTLFPLLIVLDSDPNFSQGSRLMVFRIKSFVNLVLIDELVVSETEYFTKINFIRTDDRKMIHLSSSTSSRFIDVSPKGKLWRDLTAFTPIINNVDIFKYGRLQDNVLMPAISSSGDDRTFDIYDTVGNKKNSVELAELSTYTAMKCIPCHDSGLCLAARQTESSPKIDMFKFMPYSGVNVVHAEAKYIEWEDLKKRIDIKFDILQEKHRGHTENKSKYLLSSGSVITGDWTLNKLKVSDLTMPQDSLSNTEVNLKVVDSNGTESDVVLDGSQNTRPVLDIHLDEVAELQDEIISKTSELQNHHEQFSLKLNATHEQIISNIELGTLAAENINSIDGELLIENLKQSDIIKSLSDLASDTFLKNDPKPMLETKTFPVEVSTSNLETNTLSDASTQVSPASCLVKNKNITLTVSQVFQGLINIGNLKMSPDASLSNGQSNIKSEDLLPHGSLPGYFNFEGTLKSPGINSVEVISDLNLSNDTVNNIVLRDSANTIDGKLVVNINGESSENEARGSKIVMDGRTYNEVDLLECVNHSVRIFCQDCDDLVVNIGGRIEFTGEVTVNAMQVTTINSFPFESYIKAERLANPLADSFLLSGQKTIRIINVGTLNASDYSGLRLDDLLTTNTEQVLAGPIIFHKEIEFENIEKDGDYPYALIDSVDLFLTLRSDLKAVAENQPWIQNNTITNNVTIKKIIIESGAGIKIADLVNSMNVPETLERVVRDEDGMVNITGRKLVQSEINLMTVDTDNIVAKDSGVSHNINDFVNTITTQTISGIKRFAETVELENIFTIGSRINDLSIAELLHCFVDAGNHTDEDILINSPIIFDKISVPRIELGRDETFEECNLVPENITMETATAFIGLELAMDESAGGSDLLAQQLMYTYILQNYAMQEDMEISMLSVDQMRLVIDKLLHTRHGFPLSYLSRLSDLEVLQDICRLPKVNKHKPSLDVALLDGDNHFCSTSANCIQTFQQGFVGELVNVTLNVMVNPDHTVFGVDVSEFNMDRISLTNPNMQVTGDYVFESISLKPDEGIYSGELQIATSDGPISSNDYPQKFLKNESETSQEFIGASVELTDISASVITADVFQVDSTVIDIVDLDQRSHDLDGTMIIDNLNFDGSVQLRAEMNMRGTLDGVRLEDLHDVLLHGEDYIVDETISIAGTDRDKIVIPGYKTFDGEIRADNVLPEVTEEGLVNPEVLTVPCKEHHTFVGLISGNIISSVMSESMDECQSECRREMCHALSYNSLSGECRLFFDYPEADTAQTNYTSRIYRCWVQLQSSESSRYLNIDAQDNLITSEVATNWIFDGVKLVHKASNKLVSLDEVNNPVLSDASTSNEETNEFVYVGTGPIQIKSEANGLWMNEGADGSVVMTADNLTSWITTMGSVRFSVQVEGNVETRILTKSTDQVVTGGLKFAGGVINIENSTLLSPNIGLLQHSQVSQIYSWNEELEQHQISADFVIVGENSTMIENLTSHEYDSIFEDIIYLNTTEEITLQGTTTLGDVDFGSSSNVVVTGLVAGLDIDDENANIARTNVDNLVFTELNTFVQVEGTDSKFEANNLVSSTDMFLGQSQIQGGVDMSVLNDQTISTLLEDPVIIRGKVVFGKVFISGGQLQMNTTHFTNLSIVIPNQLILTSDDEIDLTGFKLGQLNANEDLTINGQLFGIAEEKFLDVLYCDGSQIITSDMIFSGEITMNGNMTVNSLNGYVPQSDLVFLNEDAVIHTKLIFNQTLTATAIDVSQNVDGVNFTDMIQNMATLWGNNTISQKWRIESPVIMMSDVVGSSEMLDHTINGNKLSDILAACNIYDYVNAVKISAQSEAAVLCEFVSDLQDSFLANQQIKQYHLTTSLREEGRNLTYSKLVNFGDSGVYLIAINGQNLEVYSVNDASVTVVQSLQISETEDHAMKIQHVADLSTESEFNFAIFVGSEKVGSSVSILSFRGTNEAHTISQIGNLISATSVSALGLSKLVVLSHHDPTDLNDFGLSMLNLADLRECNPTCDNVTLQNIYCPTQQMANIEGSSGALPQVISLQALMNQDGRLIIAFNDFVQVTGQDGIRLIVLEMSSTSDCSYNIVQDFIAPDRSSAFLLVNFNTKVFLVFPGERLRMLEIDVSEGSVETLVLDHLPHANYDHLSVETGTGGPDTITGIMNGNTLVSLRYAGFEGLRTSSQFFVQHPVYSTSSLSYMSGDGSVHTRAVVGGEYITILDGVLSNPTAKAQFECPQPEIPSFWNP